MSHMEGKCIIIKHFILGPKIKFWLNYTFTPLFLQERNSIIRGWIKSTLSTVISCLLFFSFSPHHRIKSKRNYDCSNHTAQRFKQKFNILFFFFNLLCSQSSINGSKRTTSALNTIPSFRFLSFLFFIFYIFIFWCTKCKVKK